MLNILIHHYKRQSKVSKKPLIERELQALALLGTICSILHPFFKGVALISIVLVRVIFFLENMHNMKC